MYFVTLSAICVTAYLCCIGVRTVPSESCWRKAEEEAQEVIDRIFKASPQEDWRITEPPHSSLMVATARKDRLCAIGVHKIPPHLSKKDFENTFEALMDDVLALDLVRKKVLKMEMMFQNDRLDEHVKLFEFPPREPVVVIAIETENADDLVEVLADAEVQKLFQKTEDFGLQSATFAFSADVAPKINRNVTSTQKPVRIVGIYKVPTHLSRDEYGQKFHAFVEKYIALPAIQKNLVRYEVWQQNDAVGDRMMQNLAHPVSEPTFLVRAESETLDHVIEYLNDPQARKLVQDAKQDFGFNTNACLFTADVVTKIDKS
ncbi:hypothetical protein GGX14DRAFT_397247 [Mycena pura]|uniref:Uncharacterized protein n=1 Tax=Mycena pura TaxID=153505 RepID=A0AAD6V8D0_9AGAR|nr:hypothetical protein GGX14DRAFT_397247 [Mycena pura]